MTNTEGRADWAQYTERFRREMECDSCIAEMKRIWDLSRTKDVYLVCFEKDGDNCHRHILMGMMAERFEEQDRIRTEGGSHDI
jgi:uncharacterized protein YeaO (DUF488 family)